MSSKSGSSKSVSSGARLEDVEEALERLFRLGANRRFDARQKKAVGESVTRAGYAVLRCLTSADDMAIRDLADACVMDAATASRQVDRLVGDGLVARRTARNDARAVEVAITDHGRDVYRAIVDHRLSYLADALDSWDDDDLESLTATVGRLTADLVRG